MAKSIVDGYGYYDTENSVEGCSERYYSSTITSTKMLIDCFHCVMPRITNDI